MWNTLLPDYQTAYYFRMPGPDAGNIVTDDLLQFLEKQGEMVRCVQVFDILAGENYCLGAA